MTIASQSRTAGPFTGTGLLVSYPFAFKVFTTADLLIQQTDTSGAVTPWTLGSNYTVVLNSNQSVSPGGTITPLVALPTGYLLNVTSAVALTQPASLTNAGGFFPTTIEDALDRLTILIQQALGTLTGALRVPEITGTSALPAAATRANQLLSFDASGNPIVVAPVAGTATALATNLANVSNGFGADIVAGGGRVVSTIAAIRTLAKTGIGKAFAVGYYAAGDGGGGQYFYDSTDTTSADNGGTIIVAADGGRWKLAATAPIHMRQFGAKCDGTTNDSVALQAAHDAIALAGGGRLNVSQAKLNSTFNWDANKVAVEGDGGLWDVSGLAAAAYGVNAIQSETDVNLRCMKNRAHPFRGVRLGGPIGVTTVNGINIADTVGNTIPGLIFENGGCSGFVADFTFGAGTFFTTVKNWDLTSDTAGRKSQRNWVFPASANSGERNVWDNVRFGLVTVENFNVTNGNSDTVFHQCSFNYAPRFGTINAGQVKMIAPHLEWSSDADWKIYLAPGGNAQCTIIAPSFNIAAAQAVKAFAYVDVALNTTGLTIKDGVVGCTNPITVPWADGGGRVLVSNMGRYTSTGYMYGPAAGSNMLAYGDFESANFTAEFSLQGPTPPARSTTIAKQGTNSLRFQGVAAQTNYANVSVPCTVGQTINFSLWYNGTGITGTSTTFQAQMQYLDANNNVLSTSSVFSITTTPAGWTLATPAASFAAAPNGTVRAQLQTIISGTASGTPLGYIDIVNMVAQ